MTYKLAQYYVVKVYAGRTTNNSIVKEVEYLAGPFGNHNDDLMNIKREYSNININNNVSIEIATQYIEVEL